MIVVGLKSKAVVDFLKQPYRSPWKWHSARSRLIYGLNRYFQGSKIKKNKSVLQFACVALTNERALSWTSEQVLKHEQHFLIKHLLNFPNIICYFLKLKSDFVYFKLL